MPSRYPKSEHFDYCLNPLHLKDGEKDVVVPCGKCKGCLVHAANIWSQRLGMEIESCPDSIFVTPTYSNLYLPKMVILYESCGLKTWSSNHRDNWRFAGNRCSLRNDDITIVGNYDPIPVTNFDSYPCIPYASKRDIQLWLKLIRKDLDLNNFKTYGNKYFRYFIISEYGETRYRPHYHCIFFPLTHEVGQYLVESSLFKNWKMCDEDLFREYTVFCNSSTSNYLTTYVNSLSRLPEVYRDNEVHPFRLSSKSPSIGYMSYDREKVLESIVEGNFEYNRKIERLTDKYVLRYSKNYLFSTFPKCAEYGRKSFDELLFIYGLHYRYFSGQQSEQRTANYQSVCITARLPENLRSSDFNASRKCYKVCSELGCTPFHYLYLLDKAWYLNDMYALKMFYTVQESKGNSFEVLMLYNNLGDVLEKYRSGILNDNQIFALDLFLESFCLDPLSVLDILPHDLRSPRANSSYEAELDDILENMVKMPKFNESLGVSPVNLF